MNLVPNCFQARAKIGILITMLRTPTGETGIKNLARYRVRSLPAAGALLKDEDRGEEQLSLLDS